MTGADRARILAQTLSEVINALALLAFPDQFGAFPDDGWQSLQNHLAYLHVELHGGTHWPRELQLDELRNILPELVEAVAQAPRSAEHRARAVALAARFVEKLPHPGVSQQ